MISLVPLKHLATIRVSNVDKKMADGDTPVRLCNYTDVYYRRVIRADQEFMAASATPEQVMAFRLQPGDIIITKDSETADDIGVPAYVEDSAPDLVCGYHLAIIRPWTERIDGSFLYWAMASTAVREQLAVAATGVTRYGLRADSLGGVRLLCPEIAQQRAIAGFLDAETARIDSLINTKQRLVALLQSRISSSIDAIVRSLQIGSSSVPVKYLVREVDDRLGEREPITMLSVSIHLGVVPRASMTGDLPRAENLSNYKVCREGDLVINRMRAFQGGVGRSPMSGMVSPDYTVLRPTAIVDALFLHFIFRSSWFVGEMSARLRGIGSADQGNVRTPRVNFGDLGLIEMPVPPLSTQSEIANTLDLESRRITSTVKALAHQTTLLMEHRQSLITASTGVLNTPGSTI